MSQIKNISRQGHKLVINPYVPRSAIKCYFFNITDALMRFYTIVLLILNQWDWSVTLFISTLYCSRGSHKHTHRVRWDWRTQFWGAFPAFIAVILPGRRADGFRGRAWITARADGKNRGARRMTRAEEIIGEAGTTCNLEFWRWTFKVAITVQALGTWLNSIHPDHTPFLRTHTHDQISLTHKLSTFHEKVKLFATVSESIDWCSFDIREKCADGLENGLKEYLIKVTFCQ